MHIIDVTTNGIYHKNALIADLNRYKIGSLTKTAEFSKCDFLKNEKFGSLQRNSVNILPQVSLNKEIRKD